jgi:DNA invertase Pin-like site-specific DNA recombinase
MTKFGPTGQTSQPEKRLIGYARVSTYGQTLDSQLDQLRQQKEAIRRRAQGATLDELARSNVSRATISRLS